MASIGSTTAFHFVLGISAIRCGGGMGWEGKRGSGKESDERRSREARRLERVGVQKEEKETGRREERFRIVRGAATNTVSNEPRVGS